MTAQGTSPGDDPGGVGSAFTFLHTLPFILLLLSIAILPLAVPRWWERNRNKLFISLLYGIPVVVLLFVQSGRDGGGLLVHSMKEYIAFIALLASLFIIAGGVYLRGSLSGTPIANTGMLAIGGVLASFIGTTGASVLLVRPLLRANMSRVRKAHIFIFFIFIVSNAGGLLTPLGDPPLFLGFLRGVPFTWTFRLFLPWLLVNGALLVIFNLVDQYIFDREEKERPGSQLEEVQAVEKLAILGRVNFLFLLGVLGVIFAMGTVGQRFPSDLRLLVQTGGMLAMAGLSLAVTPKAYREANRFSWGPINEVAVIFLGIFITMTPALHFLEARGGDLGLDRPWQYFWATGGLSTFLDNAPTYLTFASLAVGVVNRNHAGAGLSSEDLGGLLAFPDGAVLLTAISCGAVFMGANSYIGNGPNFMVKAIVEEGGVRMPSFFGYMAWTVVVLVPIFMGVTFLFFR